MEKKMTQKRGIADKCLPLEDFNLDQFNLWATRYLDYVLGNQTAPIDVEQTINDEYPDKDYGENIASTDEFTHNEIALLNRIAARFGYNLAKTAKSPQVDWEKLRDAYFKECVVDVPASSMLRVCLAPHDLFEWFKSQLSNVQIMHNANSDVEQANGSDAKKQVDFEEWLINNGWEKLNYAVWRKADGGRISFELEEILYSTFKNQK